MLSLTSWTYYLRGEVVDREPFQVSDLLLAGELDGELLIEVPVQHVHLISPGNPAQLTQICVQMFLQITRLKSGEIGVSVLQHVLPHVILCHGADGHVGLKPVLLAECSDCSVKDFGEDGVPGEEGGHQGGGCLPELVPDPQNDAISENKRTSEEYNTEL